MMPINEGLQSLLEQAQIERDAALALLQRADEEQRQARSQCEQLLVYRDDYRRRAPALAGRSTSIEMLRCHQGFMQRLDQAIDQQRSVLEAAEIEALARRATLLARETRVAAVRKLIERRNQEFVREQARRDQRQTDEVAQRLVGAASRLRSEHGETSR